jgi:hypothetical protein
MAVVLSIPYLTLGFKERSWNYDPDAHAPQWEVGKGEHGRLKQYMFEVKPAIPSLGEVIRQIRMYEQYEMGAEFYVVSPDARFKAALEAQKIGFLLCPDLR